MSKIHNRLSLLRSNKFKSTKLALDTIDNVLTSVDPYHLISNAIHLSNSTITIRSISGESGKFQLDSFNSIYIIGAGKAVAKMSDVLSSILGNKLTGGAITTPSILKNESTKIIITKASHPIPDKSGIEGTRKILRIIKNSEDNDLIFFLLSGGASALMPLPYKGIELGDKQKITSLLLASGANIDEINAVRKHVSAVKGGRLAEYVRCTVISLILSDVVGDRIDVIGSGPTVPDVTTYQDTLFILKKYKIWDNYKNMPESVRSIINYGINNEIKETPKPGNPIFKRIHNFLIGNNEIACVNAKRFLEHNGIKTMNLGSTFTGSACDFGLFISRLTNFLSQSTPYAFVLGGETTVKLNKNKNQNGFGGRNQESALSSAINIKEFQDRDFTIACFGTDGIDGNTPAAGAIITPRILLDLKSDKIDLRKYLRCHNSNTILKKFNGLILTGRTGTNVNDIAIIVRTK